MPDNVRRLLLVAAKADLKTTKQTQPGYKPTWFKTVAWWCPGGDVVDERYLSLDNNNTKNDNRLAKRCAGAAPAARS